MPIRHTFQLLSSMDMERPGSFSWDGSESAGLPVMSAEEMCRTAAERIRRAGGHRASPELEQGEQSRGLGRPDLARVGEKPFCVFLGPFLGSGPYMLGEILSGCVAVGRAAWERASFSRLFCFSSLLASPSSALAHPACQTVSLLSGWTGHKEILLPARLCPVHLWSGARHLGLSPSSLVAKGV